MKEISERLSLFFALASILLLVGYAVVQLYAGYAGIEYHLGVAWAIAAVIVTFVFRLGLLITIGAFFCALNIWNWHWIFALLFAAPGLVFLALMLPRIFASVIDGLHWKRPGKSGA